MGYTTQEFTSAALTNLYPSYYCEMQYINWAHVDVVITKANGVQIALPKSDTPVREEDACIVIESREFNGLRIQSGSMNRQSPDAQIPAKRINVKFESFRNSPIRIEEYDVIISTVEQSMVAKNMMCEINYGSMLNETRTDVEMTDPRLVFQVIDPNNLWDMLLVHVFGQTVILRAGHYGKLIPPTVAEPTTSPDKGRLICYLRYPTKYYSTAKAKQVVFDIPLDDVYKKEPYQLTSGDYVCIATSMEDLQEIVAKKANCSKGIISAGNISEKMIPKEVYEAAETNHKTELERVKQESKQRYDTLATLKANELAKLQAKLDEVTFAKEKAEAKVREWEAIHEASSKNEESRQKINAAEDKARKEANDNARQDIENMWLALKIGGSILSAVASFALTMLVQSSKKK